MTHSVLLLNADYTPLRVISWEDAIVKLMDRKVHLVTEYAGKVIRSAHMELAFPAVVALVKYASASKKIRFNRANLFARDNYTCAYCGTRPLTAAGRPKLEDLTIDHVVPRAQSVKGMVKLPWSGQRVATTCWENVTTACYTCNFTKADRTPQQAGMKLRKTPSKPNAWESVLMTVRKTHVPDEWKDFLPQDSAWRDYWNTELDAE
jgi:5-methylcytosine-specific restriction endonuclease McrA